MAVSCVKLIYFIVLHLLIIQNNCHEFSNCVFNFLRKNHSLVYNFSRLSQDTWQTVSGDQKIHVYVSMCSSLNASSSSPGSIVSKHENGTWNIIMSNSSSYNFSSPSDDRQPVFELVGKQTCIDDTVYRAQINFVCSVREEGPIFLDVLDHCKLLLRWQTPAACPVNKKCVIKDYDLSSLEHPDHYIVKTRKGREFHINFCGPIRSGPCSTNMTTVCEIFNNGTKNTKIMIGNLQNQYWEILGDKTPVMTYLTTPNEGTKTEISFICNASATSSIPTFLDTVTKKSMTIYKFEVETPQACIFWPYDCVVYDSKGAHYDFSPLRRLRNWDTRPSNHGFQYHLNVCGPLNLVENYNCSDGISGACLTTSESKTFINLGSATGITINPSNVLELHYTGGSLCPTGGRHSAHVEFSCSRSDKDPVFLQESAGCVHHFSWETTAACPTLLSLGENCMVTEKLYGHQYNLTRLRSLHTLTTDHGFTFNINICGQLKDTCNGHNASVCLIQDSKEFAIGYSNSSVVYENGGLRFELRGESCKPGKSNSHVTIILMCRHGEDLGQPEPIPQVEECNFFFIWYTNVACPHRYDVHCTVSDGDKYYDLSSLTDYASNYVVKDPGSKVNFILNVCHNVVFGHDSACQYSSAACLHNLSNPDITSRFTNIGDVTNGPYIEKGELKLKYEKGDICRNPDGPDQMSTTINFICDPEVISDVTVLSSDDCDFEFLWRTKAACPIQENTMTGLSCTVQDPVTNHVFDMRPLSRREITVSDEKGLNYTFAVCGNLMSGLCKNSGACQAADSQSGGVGNAKLQYRTGAIFLNYTDGVSCNGKLKRHTVIEFICAVDASSEHIYLDASDNCAHLISWHTTLACSRKINCAASVDLSSFARTNKNYIVEGDKNTIFYINICRPLVPVSSVHCPGGSLACVAKIEDETVSNEKSLGYSSDPVIEEGGNVTLIYREGSACDKEDGKNLSAVFHFICNPIGGLGSPSYIGSSKSCEYEFIWKTSMTCEPYMKQIAVGSCILYNDQVKSSMNLDVLGTAHLFGQDYNYVVDPCHGTTGVMKGDANGGRSWNSYGTLTSAVYEYFNQQVRLQYSNGSSCNPTSSEVYKSVILLKCGSNSGVGKPILLVEQDCRVIILWENSFVCEIFDPSPHVAAQEAQGTSVTLVIVLIFLILVLCSLVMYFRKAANRSQFKGRISRMLGMRHSGEFHYSRGGDEIWSDH